jgi:radical SAM superfamily enzyme YgiQ (UPF0313 family)
VKVVFIRPHLFDTRSADALEPLAFAVLAGATPPDVRLQLHDERLAPVPLDESADLVGITVETYTARRAYQIADHYRGRGIPVVMGGYHPSFMPDEAASHADAVVVGDADSIWPDVVRDAREGRLKPRYRADAQPPLDGVRYDRSIFHGLGYPRVASVQVSRGCRYACDFCSIHAFYGSRVRQRPAQEVAAEIAATGRRRVLIVDDNLFTDRTHACELFRALIPLNIQWGCQITVDVADDGALLDLMAQSGCVAALVGFESLDSDNLRQMNKAWMLRRQSTQAAVGRLHDRGIMVYGSFIFGYDHDTPDTIRRTVDFALDAKLFLANISVLTPMPGSRLYQRLQGEGRLLFDSWWLDPRYSYGDVTYRPARMTAEALYDGCRQARAAFYEFGALARRLTNVRANARSASHLGLFLAANLVSRRELASKIGRPLGAAGRPDRLHALRDGDSTSPRPRWKVGFYQPHARGSHAALKESCDDDR